ncbi:MAG: glycosyltransferase family 2 protein [Bacteroidetes bacterium]|nr:glycosyltransferase family 2 protein [Bacteroidota bacterium]MBS1933471.1 glycosyltransferase family 2 protein [Bacteroidota bacterium]
MNVDLLQKSVRPRNEDEIFSIIIPTWNNLAYLKLCVESIRKNSQLKHQIIIHINEGKDGTLDWVKQQQDLDYTFSENNIGICYALNTARNLMVTDYLVYMNDDMYACPDWDTALFNEIKQIGHSRFFLSSTMIEPYAGNNCVIVKNYGTSIDSFKEKELLQEYSSFTFNDWQGATWPPNVVHKDVWDLVGGYSKEFSPGMYSDPDFSMKLWKEGIRLFKGVSNSRVYHFGKKSTKRISQTKAQYLFIKKWKITSGTFTKYYLRRGEPFNGLLSQPVLPLAVKLKNLIKRIRALFYRPD